ncbi:hypothetical protein OAV22_02045 [Flavobacteriaceae bacterium]|nr:hypothetical protein [Flavobacteriaceae bacterium]
MKKRTIKTVLNKKMNDWLNSIDDEKVRNVAMENAIVTGGAIASMVLNEKVNDYDIYFKTTESAKIVGQYYLDSMRKLDGWKFDELTDEKGMLTDANRVRVLIPSAGVAGDSELDKQENEAALFSTGDEDLIKPDDETTKYNCQFVTENAITLTHKIQLIMRFTGEPEKIHENYDFMHAMGWYNVQNGELNIPDGVYECLVNRELKYVGSLYPFASIVRVRKFVKRGWQINAGQILKMAMQLNDLDLKDPNVLREQLTGVDLTYFAMLISAIGKEEFTTKYICEVIDRIFG